jgi:hypothetical protein
MNWNQPIPIPPKLAIIALFSTALLSGCGTTANMNGKSLPLFCLPSGKPPEVFGGVGWDIRWISDGKWGFVFDLPFSFVGDLISIPEVLWGKPPPGPRTLPELDEK